MASLLDSAVGGIDQHRESRDEDLRSSDQCHRSGNGRKSLGVKYMDNKNNNTSIPHMYTYMSMRTRAHESPMDELRLLRNFPAGHSLPGRGHQVIATRLAARRPGVASCHVPSPRTPTRRRSATRGHTVAHGASASLADLCRANRYFRAGNRRKTHAGTAANYRRVCFFGPCPVSENSPCS